MGCEISSSPLIIIFSLFSFAIFSGVLKVTYCFTVWKVTALLDCVRKTSGLSEFIM